MNLEPLADKLKSFGFEIIEINGHDVEVIRQTFTQLPLAKNKPTAVICHTVKGKGIPFAEGSAKWHYKRVDSETITQVYSALEGE
jgi:transketolase